MQTKTCPKCGYTKNEDEFQVLNVASRKAGFKKYGNICHECGLIRQKKYHQLTKTKLPSKKTDIAKRKCLTCQKQFTSSHKYNRMCIGCHEIAKRNSCSMDW